MRQLSPVIERAEADLEVHLLEESLYGAAREFLARPSKGFRRSMIQVCYTLAGGAGAAPEAAHEMIELLHSGSLIVDDIQDGAELRRGGPALHQLIGVPRALNTGNWLYFVALGRLDELALDDAESRVLTMATLACLVDCHKGQALDLSLRVRDVHGRELTRVAELITQYKTAGPMGLAARIGATAAGASREVIESLVRVGERVGQALQMLDDLGSFVAPARHHKGVEDLVNQRVSWVWAWASELVDASSLSALTDGLADAGSLACLRQELSVLVEPTARVRVREVLRAAERELRESFAPSPALELVRAELARLELSYG